jgi:tRNA wybutosine-synthesizing protein 1
MNERIKAVLLRQKYMLLGKQTAAKLCHWTRRSILEDRVCYKQKFYGIESHRCLQMTPAIDACNHKCLFCWRNTMYGIMDMLKEYDEPEFIIDECLRAQKKMLVGYYGIAERVNKEKLDEAQNPTNVAISLAGEPALYPKLSELVSQFKRRGFSTFLVTNGTRPKVLETMELPSNLYMTLPAPDEETYKRTCIPQEEDSWKKIEETIGLFPSLSTKTVFRLTLVRELNMGNPEGYTSLIERASPTYVEAKAYMFVGSSRARMKIENMPSFQDVMAFSRELENHSSYKIVNWAEDSRVVLLTRP